MTIQETIEKAINGGWKLPPVHPFGEIQFIRSDTRPKSSFHLHSDSLFLDPLFWQSLGKAMGWRSEHCVTCGAREDNNFPHMEPGGGVSMNHDYFPWKGYWHRFIDHIADGGTPEDFFKQL